jgi:hypothetical protein
LTPPGTYKSAFNSAARTQEPEVRWRMEQELPLVEKLPSPPFDQPPPAAGEADESARALLLAGHAGQTEAVQPPDTPLVCCRKELLSAVRRGRTEVGSAGA